MTDFAPTHQAPFPGLATWPEPDASATPGPAIGARLPLALVSEQGAWARVRCENGWEAWVDGRLLEPLGGIPTAPPAPPPPAPPPPAPPVPAATAAPAIRPSIPLVGAGVAALSVFLPWISVGGPSANAFDVPVSFLFSYEDATKSGLGLGLLVLGVAGATAAVIVRGGDARLRRSLGSALVSVTVLFALQLQRLLGALGDGGFVDPPSLPSALGFGALLAVAGGAAAAFAPMPEPAR